MRVIWKLLHLSLVVLSWFIVCFLFSKSEIFWGVILSIFLVFDIFESLRNAWRKDIEAELYDIKDTLLWMGEAMLDHNYRKIFSSDREEYRFIKESVEDGTIKEGMSVEEFVQIVKSRFPKEKEDVLLSSKLSYGYLIKNKEDAMISFQGYGEGIHAPEIYIYAKNGKIVSVEIDNVFPFKIPGHIGKVKVKEVPFKRKSRQKVDAIMNKHREKMDVISMPLI